LRRVTGAVHFGVVRAESIRRVVGIVKAHYPGARVVYPIKAETFFILREW
jgi:hypothetical protein